MHVLELLYEYYNYSEYSQLKKTDFVKISQHKET